jgi:hypothetical protein
MNLARLLEPFESDQHQFLNGFIYIDETAIAKRLDEVAGLAGWQTFEPHPPTQINHNHWSVSLDLALYVDGIWVTRNGRGEGITAISKTFDWDDVRRTAVMAENTVKKAHTDAFKRVARAWGIGRYILSIPRNVQDNQKLNEWIRASVYNSICFDTEIRERYAVNQHLDNALGMYQESTGQTIIADGFTRVKYWLLNRDSTS